MQAKEISLKDIMIQEPHKLEIPFFQRRYVWQEENWRELLEAICNADKEKIFWGSIIIKKVSVNKIGSQCTKGYIIDGQQRLTTIALLTKAIYDSLSESSKPKMESIISGCVFYPLTAMADFKNRNDYDIIIEHSRYDRADFDYVINAGMFGNLVINIDYQPDMKESQIKKCYAFFRSVLKGKNDNELAQIVNTLYGDEKYFVYILLDENDVNEQVIFDSINRAGQKLYTSDIIKNNMFKKMMSMSLSTSEVEEKCDKNWDLIFWEDGDVDNFWDAKRQFGNVPKSHLDFLLYCVACIEWPEEDVKRINEKLECVYEEKTAHYTEDELVALSEDIATYALIYKKYIIEFEKNIDDETFEKDEDVKRLLLIMSKFNIQMFYPFVLKCLFDNTTHIDIEKQSVECDFKKEELKRQCKLLETYLMRRRICGTGTSKYSKDCAEILNNGIDSFIGNISDSYISDENDNIRMSLKNVDQNLARMLLFCLELTLWDEQDDLGPLSYGYEVEHIMPQKWMSYWSIPSTGNSELDKENAVIRNSAVKELGNRILLTSKLNASIKNREYQTKMEGENATGKKKKKPGYKDKTQLKLTKELVDAYVNGDHDWDEAHISARTSKLANSLISMWDYKKYLK